MKTFTMLSALSKKELCLVMKSLTSPNSDNRKFSGAVTEDSFSIIEYHFFSNNVVKPQIDASLTESVDGTIIRAKVTLNKIDKMCFSIMSAIICCIIVLFIVNAIVLKSVEPIFLIIAVLCFQIIIAVVFGFVFTFKLRKIIEILKRELSVK